MKSCQAQYKVVDTGTLKGLREAERLHRAGWKTLRVILNRVYFYKSK